ncbi:DUF4145 domain-containing protein [Ferrimonas senticii]|uniref:DUF4145 domain-containing protein n=1 Tax=Ferrimonas senticii TaxID=394566 RepID=UPI0003F912C8|nr:DUF4145 domain-containing protein [Ferrimonas senticii]
MHTSNFEFIANVMPLLYRSGSLSEHYYHLDRQGCAAKLRLFAEQCVNELMAHYQCDLAEHSESLNERLNRLSFETPIPDDLIALLHQLRSAGNVAVHAQQGDAALAKNQVRELLKAAHKLAEFVYLLRFDGQVADIAPWQEPPDPGASYLYQLAFEGDAEACFALAQQLNEQLQQAFATKAGQRSQQQLSQQQQLRADVDYWLGKAIRQHHWPSQLLAAQIDSGLLNTPAQVEQAEHYFELALTSDESQVQFHYASFVRSQENGSKWLKLMHRAAAGGWVAATQTLIEYYAEQNQLERYQECVELGMAQNLGAAFALQLLALGTATTADADVDKQGRNLMIRAQATGERSIAFARGFCLFLGRFGYPQDRQAGYQLMRQHYQQLPSSRLVNPAAITFMAGEQFEADSSERVSQAEAAVIASTGSELEAHIAFAAALLLMRHIAEKGSYKGVLVPKVLLQRAAELGHEEAQRFMRSQQGKAQLAGLIAVGRPKADRKKQADKRKAAKRARKKR